jgi:hypothetical protein
MEEADRRISERINKCGVSSSNWTYRNAGRRPKKATNVTSDTVTVKMMMLRASVMVKERKLPYHEPGA